MTLRNSLVEPVVAAICVGTAALVLGMTAGCGSSAAVAAIGVIGGGVTTGLLIDKLAERATNVAQNAAAAGSLVSSKAARDLQLLIDATRQGLKDDLNQQWDRLDSQKISLLRELDAKVRQAEDMGKDFGRLEDKIFLDTDALVSRIPFAEKMPRIRTVEGASQHFKTIGTYNVHITSNLFEPFGPEVKFTLNGKPFDKITPKPPYTVTLAIPTSELNDKFRDFHLAYAPITISAQVIEKSIFGNSTKPYTFTIPLELFPKYPASYQLVEFHEVQAVDNRPESIQIAPGAFQTIPGCGDSGCNAYYNVCTNFPVGAQPIQTVNHVDTFSGWGGFGEVTYGASQACQRYWQHSHNVARNVKMDVQYRPLKPEIRSQHVKLKEILVGDAEPNCSAVPQELSAQRVLPPTISFLGLKLIVPQPVETKDKVPAETKDKERPPVCWLKLGVTYSGDFTAAMKGYNLAIRAFNGQNYAATETTADKAIEIHSTDQTNFKRITFKLREPDLK